MTEIATGLSIFAALALFFQIVRLNKYIGEVAGHKVNNALQVPVLKIEQLEKRVSRLERLAK